VGVRHLTEKTNDQWCIRDDAATICGAPATNLGAEQMPVTFGDGVAVRGQLTGGAPTSTWIAIVMQVG
jgi:hypothetical protein